MDRLWRAGLEELAARGAHSDIVAWLGGGREGDFPKAACPSPSPAGHHVYWNNGLKQWYDARAASHDCR